MCMREMSRKGIALLHVKRANGGKWLRQQQRKGTRNSEGEMYEHARDEGGKRFYNTRANRDMTAVWGKFSVRPNRRAKAAYRRQHRTEKRRRGPRMKREKIHRSRRRSRSMVLLEPATSLPIIPRMIFNLLPFIRI